MIRRPPRSTLDRSSAASDVYKRQEQRHAVLHAGDLQQLDDARCHREVDALQDVGRGDAAADHVDAVSYTHLRAHETVLDLVCRLLLETQKNNRYPETISSSSQEIQLTLR